MRDFLTGLLASDGFHPHGYCYLWKPELIWLHVVTDVLIALSYVAIGLTLVYFVRRGRGVLPFSRIFVAFGVFIVACGATHVVEVWTLWTPVYWLAGGVKIVTAAASVATALVLPPLVPVALATLRDARLSEQRRRELEEANVELASLNARLKEADEARTRFFANASHELRTPLALILGPTERLLANAPQAERRHLETIRRNAALLLGLVNDLLDVSRLEAGRMEARYAAVDLAHLVRLSVLHFETAAADRGISLTIQAPGALHAEVDPEMVQRVLINLLGNALRFTPNGGRIRCVLEVEEGGGRAVLSVHDSGPGVAPREREAVFEPFRHGSGGVPGPFGGTGLGLAIVRSLVELHGGAVFVGDSPEGGALFSAVLPLRAPAATEVGPARVHLPGVELVAPAAVEDAPAPQPAEDDGRPLVLVVEDNPEMNRFVAESLAPEYRVEQAFDGREGTEKALRLLPDLVLSDLMMPVQGGEALVREVRRHPGMDAVPIVLLSARADDELRVRLLREGVQDYLVKPFATEELRARVGNWVRVKRARDVLRRELDATWGDVESLARDLADRKQTLERALEAARLAAAEAEAANRAKADFLSVMSHELRTPLNAIVGYADLLDAQVAGPLGEGQRAQLARIRASSLHLTGLVGQILHYARVEAGSEETLFVPTELRELVREAAALVEPEAREKGLEVRVRAPAHPVACHTDPGKVRQILLNLAGNAVKFTERGEVVLEVGTEGEMVFLRVRDTGVGIPAGERERIWEPFWQADPSKTRRAGGTGLGLSISRKLAHLLGGEVDVESAPGHGSAFTVWLPAHAGATPPASPEPSPAPAPSA